MTVARVPGRISIRSRGPLDELQSVVAASNEETCDDISYRFGRSWQVTSIPSTSNTCAGKCSSHFSRETICGTTIRRYFI